MVVDSFILNCELSSFWQIYNYYSCVTRSLLLASTYSSSREVACLLVSVKVIAAPLKVVEMAGGVSPSR